MTGSKIFRYSDTRGFLDGLGFASMLQMSRYRLSRKIGNLLIARRLDLATLPPGLTRTRNFMRFSAAHLHAGDRVPRLYSTSTETWLHNRWCRDGSGHHGVANLQRHRAFVDLDCHGLPSPAHGSRGANFGSQRLSARLDMALQPRAFSQVRGSPFDSIRPGSTHLPCFWTKRPPVQIRPPRPLGPS